MEIIHDKSQSALGINSELNEDKINQYWWSASMELIWKAKMAPTYSLVADPTCLTSQR